MEACPNRPIVLRTLAVVLAVLVALGFAFQVRDGGALEGASTRVSTPHFIADAFPTAEASVVTGR